MTKRLVPLTLSAIILACAGGQSAGGAPTAETKQRLSNLVPFDLANCFTKAIELGKPVNEYALQAAFRAARPAIQECLTDGRTYEASKPVKGTATITVDASGPKVAVAGEGLQPAAQSCIQKTVGAQLANAAPLAADAKPVSFTGPFERGADTGVRLGINEVSDVEGAIRLALPQWCTCFEPYRTKAPPQLSGQIDVVRSDVAKFADRFKLPDGGVRSTQPVISTLRPSESDPAATQVANCLNQRVEQLQFKTTPDQLIVPAQFLLINSNSNESLSQSAAPVMQFAQLDAVIQQREAESFAQLARRQTVADAYDQNVQRYQAGIKSKDAKKRRAADALVKDLKTGCVALVRADDEYTHALEAQGSVEQKALEMARAFKAKDPSWADAETAAVSAAADTQKQLDASRQLRTANEKACPKEKF
jgi:hypothetical protein